jgi:hypothetical protein
MTRVAEYTDEDFPFIHVSATYTDSLATKKSSPFSPHTFIECDNATCDVTWGIDGWGPEELWPEIIARGLSEDGWTIVEGQDYCPDCSGRGHWRQETG